MKNKILIGILVIAVVALGILLGMKYMKKSDIEINSDVEATNEEISDNKEKTAEVKTWAGDSRSVAVVIDNVGEARPQAGLNDAVIVYEVTVEGGLTRLLAIFKNIEDTNEIIGPVRSARPVFLEYAMENDSIFTHFGYSPKAESEITQFKINNVNGLVADSVFTRTSEKKAPHNAVTTMEKIMEYAKNKGYDTTSTKKSVLNYIADEVTLEDGTSANTVNIPYTSTYKVTFKYDETTKTYERYINNEIQKDWKSGEKITTKNIIVTFAKNYTTDEENGYGRQQIVNVGNLDGYYITEGKTIEITCSKDSRTEQTVYKDKNGKEIDVNDGNTYIQIVPIDTNVTFE
jgi:hypothetical protein